MPPEHRDGCSGGYQGHSQSERIRSMNKILGIDTGGTYTDMVIVTADTKEVLCKHKTPTTKDDLCRCITNGFASLPPEQLKEISMVSLSTTLATNSIVENKGCKNGLILIGGRPKGKLSSQVIEMVGGRFDIKGRLIEPMDLRQVERVVESFRGKVDAIAVSGYASVRNPTHELYVKQVIEQRLGIPVACAHELTSSLGYHDRTVTAELNARLIPVLCELMDAVKAVMEKHGVAAPLMVVKGDGSLMTEAIARSKPIETILSGPASSVIGGVHLSGEQNAFIIDMGGTTTDIACVENGRTQIRNEGARVGGWFTHVRATEIFTVGLGGDSRIYIDSSRRINIGPEKSVPLTAAGELHPELLDEMQYIYECGSYKNFHFHDHEAYILVKQYENMTYTDDEKVLIEILRYAPHTLDYLKNHINMTRLRKILDGLTREGVVARISLTPTDVLHVTGDSNLWDPKIAEIALEILADRFDGTKEEFIREIYRLMVESLDKSVIEAAMYFDHQDVDMQQGGAYDYFLNDLFFHGASQLLQTNFSLKKKVVGIGAPADAWIRSMGQCLNAEVVIPEHAEVANAVGAAVGRDVEVIEVLIRPDSVTKKFLVYSPVGRECRDSLEEATEFAKAIGTECIEAMAENCIYELDSKLDDLNFEDVTNGNVIFMERTVRLTARFQRC